MKSPQERLRAACRVYWILNGIDPDEQTPMLRWEDLPDGGSKSETIGNRPYWTKEQTKITQIIAAWEKGKE